MRSIHGEFPQHLSAFITREQHAEAIARLEREISESRRCACVIIAIVLTPGLASTVAYIYFTKDAAYAILIAASTMVSCIIALCCADRVSSRRIRQILATYQERTPGFEWTIRQQRSSEGPIVTTRYGATGETHSYDSELRIEIRAAEESLLGSQ
jgi:hypothetical protein